jgi:glycine/D-amino acid oxidase-like deaminating enzyme
VKSEADVIIIGTGIWGLSTAYHLAREQTGRSIVVVERNAAVADENYPAGGRTDRTVAQ